MSKALMQYNLFDEQNNICDISNNNVSELKFYDTIKSSSSHVFSSIIILSPYWRLTKKMI